MPWYAAPFCVGRGVCPRPPEEGHPGRRGTQSGGSLVMSAPRWIAILALLGLTSTACSQSSGDKGGVATTGESALKVTGAAYLGPIASGETKTSYYSDPPKYRAFGFTATGGDQISIDVASVDGDA